MGGTRIGAGQRWARHVKALPPDVRAWNAGVLWLCGCRQADKPWRGPEGRRLQRPASSFWQGNGAEMRCAPIPYVRRPPFQPKPTACNVRRWGYGPASHASKRSIAHMRSTPKHM